MSTLDWIIVLVIAFSVVQAIASGFIREFFAFAGGSDEGLHLSQVFDAGGLFHAAGYVYCPRLDRVDGRVDAAGVEPAG